MFKKRVIWVFINGFFAALLYLGLFQEIKGAMHVFVFATYINVALSFFMLNDDVIKVLAEKGSCRSMGIYIDIIYDACLVVALVWHGYFVLGSFWLLSMLASGIGWDKISAYKKNNS